MSCLRYENTRLTVLAIHAEFFTSPVCLVIHPISSSLFREYIQVVLCEVPMLQLHSTGRKLHSCLIFPSTWCVARVALPCNQNNSLLSNFEQIKKNSFLFRIVYPFHLSLYPLLYHSFLKQHCHYAMAKSFWTSLSLCLPFINTAMPITTLPRFFSFLVSFACTHAFTHICVCTQTEGSVYSGVFVFVYSIHSHLTTSGYHVISSDQDVNAKNVKKSFFVSK